MKSVVIISDAALNLSNLKHVYASIGSVDLQSSERLVVEGSWGWFAINLDEEIRNEYDDEEFNQHFRLLHSPVFYQIEYSSIDAARKALVELTNMGPIYLDDDQGEIRLLTAALLQRSQGQNWL